MNNTGTPLPELFGWVEDHGSNINLDLLEHGWEINRHDTEDDRIQRALRVERDLYILSQIVIRGGVWKGIPFQPHQGLESVEILVVSHGAFLSRLLGCGRGKSTSSSVGYYLT